MEVIVSPQDDLLRTSLSTTSRDVAFDEYVRRRGNSLLRTAYMITGDAHQAEDLVQTALTRLYTAWDKVRDPDLRDGYVRRILVNENNSSWRKPWRRREVLSSEFVGSTVAAPAPDTDTRNAVWDLVRSLPPKQRTVIVLRYFEDLPIEAIADVMGISTGTVKSQANRAIATLRANPNLADLEDWS